MKSGPSSFRSLSALFFLLWSLHFPLALFAKTEIPSFITRGDQVETYYKKYTEKLNAAFEALKAATKKYAPEHLGRLDYEAPAPVQIGYQLLPKIIPEEKTPTAPPKPESISYSWKRTTQFIDAAIFSIDEVNEKLRFLEKLKTSEQKNVIARMIDDYESLDDDQKLIDHHIQYNRFWQKAIHEQRVRFDHLTVLHDSVLELETLKDRVRVNRGTNPVIEARRREIEKAIAAETLAKLQLPSFAKMKHPKPNLWIYEIPVYTDITDTLFLERFKTAVERIWRYQEYQPPTKIKTEAPPTFEVKLLIKPFTPKPAPKAGEKIDLNSHIRLFPKDGAVLTTGAQATHAVPNLFIAMGPQEVSERVLAHEFGHIIGFIDGYFRGYRNRGDEGYEVLEIVPDASDIMNNPNSGLVKKMHFEMILELLEAEVEKSQSNK